MAIGELSAGDIAIIVAYIVVVLFIGLAATLRPNRSTAEGYFLAGGTVIWLQAGCSLFGSNIGSEHFIGIAGTAAASGYAVVLFEWLAVWAIIALGWLFLPVYMASAIYTMPEYIGKRYGGKRIKILIACISLLLYIFMKISVDLYAGALFIKIALHWDLYFSILILLSVVAIYTAAGGLAAVVYTETLQSIFMIIGGSVMSIYAFKHIGGLQNLEKRYMSPESYPNDTLYNNNTCGIPRSDAFHLWRGLNADLPAISFIIGQMWCGVWYWATDQVIVQRVLAVKNLSHGKGATLLASAFKITPMFLMVLPGMISRVLYADEVACVDPSKCMEICESPIGCSNIAYPRLVVGILPHGLRGLLTAVMLSALMGSLASTFNSAGAIFTLDIWTMIRKLPVGDEINKLSFEAKKKYKIEIMVVGRLCVLVMVLISVAWIPMMKGSSGSQLFMYIQDISCTITPPIAALFTLGVLWERINEKGAFFGLVYGVFVSICRMLIAFIWRKPPCGQLDTRPPFIAAIYIHYQFFAAFLFFSTVAIIVVVSLLTDPIPPEYLYRLTYRTRFSREARKDMSLLNSSNERQPILASQTKHDNKPEIDSKRTSSEEFELVDGSSETEMSHGQFAKEEPKTSDDTDFVDERTLSQGVKGCLWRSLFWFCGLSGLYEENRQNMKISEDETEREQRQMDKVVEEPIHRFVLLICLGLLICVYLFLYIYFA